MLNKIAGWALVLVGLILWANVVTEHGFSEAIEFMMAHRKMYGDGMTVILILMVYIIPFPLGLLFLNWRRR